MSENLRQRYAEALAATNTLDDIDLAHTLDLVIAVRDEELERLREENAALLIGANPSKIAAGKRIVDSLTKLVRIERDDARADRDRWRDRAERAERERDALRQSIAARTSTPKPASGNVAQTRLDILREAVLCEGGDWTTRRAVELLNGTITSSRARVMLNKLADEGLVVKHGKLGRLWTPATREAVAES
ncbi:hypothetical protein [Nonomuraea sp. NPDC023979]|uniref:hypothetical protein n=1 Tax=Nonomuraea sp. NPDC023979 TaxID=3154796 RepID=UPI0033E83412